MAWKTCRNGWDKLNALHPLYIINTRLMRSSFSRTNLPFLSNFARIGKKWNAFRLAKCHLQASVNACKAE